MPRLMFAVRSSGGLDSARVTPEAAVDAIEASWELSNSILRNNAMRNQMLEDGEKIVDGEHPWAAGRWPR